MRGCSTSLHTEVTIMGREAIMESGHTRRQFLSATGGLFGAVALGATVPAVAASRPPTAAAERGRVAVLGGGVAGLSVAHELAERGYAVTVYEYYTALGGKARSMDVPGTGSGGRKPLPGEHGFRFFPCFYRNLPDTLRRIPFPGNAHGVHDNLRNSTDALIARSGGRPDLPVPMRTATTPPNLGELTPQVLRETVAALLDTGFHLPAHEAAYFADRLLVHLTSCDRRRDEQWEKVPWWEFIRAEQMSYDYQRLLGVGFTRSLVATKAEEASTRTVARTVVEALVIHGILGRGQDGEPDRVLNAPTSEAWIDPWVAHLRSLGVAFQLGTEVNEVVYDNGRITGLRVSAPNGSASHTVTADYYVSAMPVEHARATWGEALRAADPQLNRCDALRTDWMVGIQFYLRKPIRIIHGHAIYADSPWSLTTISQAQFWDGRHFPADYGDGEAVDCLSVCVSEWDKAGIVYGKTAKQCTREQVAKETWAQIKAALNDTGTTVLDDADLHSWFMDPAVTGIGGPNPRNREELLVHPTGTLYRRPTAATSVPNFFLAGDFVRTDVDLATMEGANESARRAVNALLHADGSNAERCRIWPQYRPPEMEPLKHVDEVRYQLGLPNTFDLG
jgi:uncharacterized protein with NAD-binding domain and iron-sulfur cluster